MSAQDYCKVHSREKVHVECWECGGEGNSHHDCGDDCCVCFDPEPNVRCDICRGKGSLMLCPGCAPEACEEAY